MNFLSAMEATLPPGFRFHPRDEELVSDYLANKVSGNRLTCTDSCDSPPYMVEVDLNKTEPWDLPEVACVGGKEWYFFSLRDRKYATGLRTNRATVSGYWKATGKDRQVVDLRKGSLVGMRKTLVFYQGRAPKGKKTDWVMHEYRLEGPAHNPKITPKEDWVLCRVLYKKRGICTKQNQESYYDDTPSSPSLPPLSDNNFLSFNQTPLNLEGSEQVHCFSSFTQNNTNPTFPHIPHLPDPNFNTFPQIEPVPDFADFLDLPSCEKTLLKAVLDHLTKMTEPPPSLGEVVRLESYLSEMGLPCLWNHFSF